MRSTLEGTVYRGSRKHVLDWTGRESFLDEFRELLGDLPVDFSGAEFMPKGAAAPQEARLETFGPMWLPGHPAWATLRSWWLAHERGANTPNWDIAVGCTIEQRPGLVLVEAKANCRELGRQGKGAPDQESRRSRENHERIGAAIEEACLAWQQHFPGMSIARDSHYQLANRMAFTWKLATLGIPTVLVYLGFANDEGISDAGPPFKDAAHWRQVFAEYSQGSVPIELLEQRLDVWEAPAWVLVRSCAVLEDSPPPPERDGKVDGDRREKYMGREGLPLQRRKNILKALGYKADASRTSWSHDLGESIVFDAWEHRWERDDQGNFMRYPLRTHGEHYNLADSRQDPRRGHTRWQNHVDLLLGNKRKPCAIVPVPNDPRANPNSGAKGWLSLVVEGHIEVDDAGQVWLYADQVVPL